MFQLRAYLLENKRRVTPFNQGVQQLLGITQQETVVVLIEFPYFLLDTAQQTELVQVTQGEVCRFIEFPLNRTFCYRKAQDIT